MYANLFFDPTVELRHCGRITETCMRVLFCLFGGDVTAPRVSTSRISPNSRFVWEILCSKHLFQRLAVRSYQHNLWCHYDHSEANVKDQGSYYDSDTLFLH